MREPDQELSKTPEIWTEIALSASWHGAKPCGHLKIGLDYSYGTGSVDDYEIDARPTDRPRARSAARAGAICLHDGIVRIEGRDFMTNPLLCERCGGELESDDAISIIEGVCCVCRRTAAAHQVQAAARPRPQRRPAAPIPPAMPRPVVPRGLHSGHVPVRSKVISSASSPEVMPSMRVRRRRRDLVIGVSVGLLVTLGTTGYVLKTRSESPTLPIAKSKPIGDFPVRIAVKPANAVVTLDGKEVGPADESGQLTFELSGRGEDPHWLEVSANGFHPVRRPLSVYSGVSEFAVELVPKPYGVAIRTTPEKAEVWINDQLKGHSPLTLTLLPWERAKLAVKRTGYLEITRELAPPTQGDQLELDLPLTPAGLSVQIETDPPGAIVTIDGAARGMTPCTAELDTSFFGKQIKIAARKDGYEEAWIQTTLPATPDSGPISARLALAPSLGATPIPMKTIASHSSPSNLVAASNNAVVAPVGQRIVFLMLSPTGVGADHTILLEQAVDQVHRLGGNQQFAILSCSADGLEQWPGGMEAAAATSDQKIRAYDKVRSIRPAGRGAVDQALRAALEMRPDSIRLFASGKLDQNDLSTFAAAVKGKPISVHIVQTESGPDDDLLQTLVAEQKGTLTVLGLAGPPAVAQQGDGVD